MAALHPVPRRSRHGGVSPYHRRRPGPVRRKRSGEGPRGVDPCGGPTLPPNEDRRLSPGPIRRRGCWR